jgi:hypothetical protein
MEVKTREVTRDVKRIPENPVFGFENEYRFSLLTIRYSNYFFSSNFRTENYKKCQK